MAIPDYQAFMQPMLILAKDQQEHSLNQVYDQLADHFQLTTAERAQLLPSGRQPTFKNRIGWARTYLSKAGLLETTRRGHFRITDLGLRELQEHGAEISSTYLRKFETFKQFQAVPRSQSEDQAAENLAISQEKIGGEIESPKETPEEAIDQAIAEMNNQLAEDLLGRLMLVSPSRFEHIVVELLVAMGYGGSIAEAGQVVGKSGDGGIDGIIKEDRLGLDLIYVQAKRWDSGISRPEIQKFVGALYGRRARKGVFITTSRFSREAIEYVGTIDSRVILIDGYELAKLMIEFNIGATVAQVYSVKTIDTDFFEE